MVDTNLVFMIPGFFRTLYLPHIYQGSK